MAARISLLLFACLCCIGLASAAPAGAPHASFVASALANSQQQLARARLALDHGHTTAVRDQAQGLIDQHQRLQDDLQTLGRKKGLLPPRDEAGEARATQARRQLADSQRFDRDYAEAQLASSRQAVELFDHQANDASDAELQRFARHWQPQLYHQREIAQQLLDGEKP